MTIANAASAGTDVGAQPDVTIYDLPPNVYCTRDETNRQWTNIAGAMQLVGRSRRTIQLWLAKGWVVQRRSAGGKPEILVASLWPTEAK